MPALRHVGIFFLTCHGSNSDSSRAGLLFSSSKCEEFLDQLFKETAIYAVKDSR